MKYIQVNKENPKFNWLWWLWFCLTLKGNIDNIIDPFDDLEE